MKIALIGSAPSSIDLAPYGDEAWTIWGCSPAAAGKVGRTDAWFELHRVTGREPHIPPSYIEWMAGRTCPVYMIERHDNIPGSVPYPKDAMIERFGRNFFTSTPAWMLALAITEVEGTPDAEIGLWGVDMAAADEWGFQKPGCLYFIEKAREAGIKVTIPPESDLSASIPLYGIGEADPMWIKLTARKAELDAKMAEAARNAERHKAAWEQAIREHHYFEGASGDVQYMLNTWCE